MDFDKILQETIDGYRKIESNQDALARSFIRADDDYISTFDFDALSIEPKIICYRTFFKQLINQLFKYHVNWITDKNPERVSFMTVKGKINDYAETLENKYQFIQKVARNLEKQNVKVAVRICLSLKRRDDTGLYDIFASIELITNPSTLVRLQHKDYLT